jgi:hypothetical protein
MGAASGAVVLLLSFPAISAAQCIMCYLSASSSGERGAQVLRLGILVLAVPTLLTFAGLFLLAYRRRNPAGEEEDGQQPVPPLSADQQDHSPSVF